MRSCDFEVTDVIQSRDLRGVILLIVVVMLGWQLWGWRQGEVRLSTYIIVWHKGVCNPQTIQRLVVMWVRGFVCTSVSMSFVAPGGKRTLELTNSLTNSMGRHKLHVRLYQCGLGAKIYFPSTVYQSSDAFRIDHWVTIKQIDSQIKTLKCIEERKEIPIFNSVHSVCCHNSR